MRPNGELRLFAVLLCNGVVCSGVMSSLNGFLGSVVFPAFLYGCVSAAVLGIPLLLLGDRRFARFKARYIVNGLIQGLIAYLFSHTFSAYPLLLSILGGLALGVLYAVVLNAIERIPVKGAALQRKGGGAVVVVPLAGGVTLGSAATLFLSGDESSLPGFVLFFLIGALLSMLVSWPVLWLVERFVATRLRYVIGGVISSMLIWLMIAAPLLLPHPAALSERSMELPPMFREGAAAFALSGLIAGILCSAFNWTYDRCRHFGVRSKD
jgi:hypothetical protein